MKPDRLGGFISYIFITAILILIGWWLYELDYGRKFEMGYLKDEQGNEIDVSTPEKLYDYLVESMK